MKIKSFPADTEKWALRMQVYMGIALAFPTFFWIWYAMETGSVPQDLHGISRWYDGPLTSVLLLLFIGVARASQWFICNQQNWPVKFGKVERVVRLVWVYTALPYLIITGILATWLHGLSLAVVCVVTLGTAWSIVLAIVTLQSIVITKIDQAFE